MNGPKGYVTTHVLDTSLGGPAEGLRIDVYRVDGDERRLIASLVTNADGRTDAPAIVGDDVAEATYELVFHAGDYFSTHGENLPSPPFLDQVVIRFGVASPGQHYHVPLLISPYGYSTYRGS